MTLNDLMKVYTGNACMSIEGYCEEEEYDYYCRIVKRKIFLETIRTTIYLLALQKNRGGKR